MTNKNGQKIVAGMKVFYKTMCSEFRAVVVSVEDSGWAVIKAAPGVSFNYGEKMRMISINALRV